MFGVIHLAIQDYPNDHLIMGEIMCSCKPNNSFFMDGYYNPALSKPRLMRTLVDLLYPTAS
jgi:hypothetical protein